MEDLSKNASKNYVVEEPVMINADEIAATLLVSKQQAYKLIREWNKELKASGKLTLRGRVNREYFKQKISC